MRAPPRHAVVAGSRRAYAAVLVLVALFIVYGSLFPFEYRERSYPGGPLAYLLSTWHEWDHRGDLLSNILLYIPFGFFLSYSLPPRISGTTRTILAIVSGTLMAACIELAQFHDVGRVTSMGDVYADAIGTAIGATGAAAIGTAMRWPFMRELGAHPTASLLLVMFFGYRLYPYVPMIDLHKYWHTIRPLLQSLSLPGDTLLRFTIIWLFIAVIIHSLYGFGRFLLLFPLIAGFEYIGRIFVVGGVLELPDVVGGIAAYLLWAGLLRWIPGRFAIVTLAFGGMIAVSRLQPLHFTATPRPFGWIPFASFVRGSIGFAMQAFCKKFYQYGGLIWLLGRCGIPLPIGTVATALLLLATSYAERWLPMRTAAVTDAAMALIIGGVFALLRGAVRSEHAAPSRAAAAEHARFAEAVLAQHGVRPAQPAQRRGRNAPYVPPHLRGS